MRRPSGGVVNIALEFPERRHARELLRQLAAQSGAAFDVVRGRVTQSEARYVIKLRGLKRGIAKACRFFTGRGVGFRVLASESSPDARSLYEISTG